MNRLRLLSSTHLLLENYFGINSNLGKSASICGCSLNTGEGFRFLKFGVRLFGGEVSKQDIEIIKKKDVLKSWVDSIVDTSSTSDTTTTTNKGVKRPPEASSVTSNPSVKFRRRLTDNMWTKEAMDDKIIWVDCEMTGLNVEKDKLMEIGLMITDANLKVIAQHDSLVFHIEEPLLQGMDAWCQKHHGESGLTSAARRSTITHEDADEMLLKFVQAHTKPGECPMAGNSIGQDRMFLMRQLPKFYKHFHYRSIDVSTIKELVRRWYPEVADAAPRKKYSHRVLDDINDSINELQFYRSTVFAPPKSASTKPKTAKEVA